MSDLFRIVIDATEFHKVELKLMGYPKKASTVISRALNRAAETVRTEAVRSTTANYYIKAKDVRGTIKIYRASPSKLGALVISRDYTIPLDKFKLSPTKPSPKNPRILKVAVKKDGLKELLHAFIAEINGPKVFERVGTSRLPIRRLMGPAIPQLLGGQKIREQVEKTSYETYRKRLDHEIRRVLEGNGS